MDLDTIIEERKQQALDRDIAGKAEAVVKELGRGKKYKDKPLAIKRVYERYEGWGVEITHGKEIVFKTTAYDYDDHARINAYKPGQWEETLESLYEEANTQILDRNWREENAENLEQAAAFGVEYVSPIKEQS